MIWNLISKTALTIGVAAMVNLTRINYEEVMEEKKEQKEVLVPFTSYVYLPSADPKLSDLKRMPCEPVPCTPDTIIKHDTVEKEPKNRSIHFDIKEVK